MQNAPVAPRQSWNAPPPGGARLPLSVLAKPIGAACNLDCSYCFFLSKEMLSDVASQEMTPQMLELYLRNFLASQPDGEVTVEWQGGEPLMRGLPFLEEAVTLANEWSRPGQFVRHSIQTNGTLLNDEWCEFLKVHDFLVGVSIDGPAQFHDQCRVNRAGRGSHRQVERGWQLLRDHGVRRNILCAVNSANEHHPLEVYRYFRDDLGARFVQFIPIVERTGSAALPYYHQAGSSVTERSVSPDGWGRFLFAVFEEWLERDVGSVYVQHFDAAVGNALGAYTVCVHAPECGRSLAVLPNGDIYACDHYVEEGYLRGNVASIALQDAARLPRQEAFGASKQLLLPKQCLECEVKWACEGGCPKDRFAGEGQSLNYLCPGYKDFYTRATPAVLKMASRVAQGLPASERARAPQQAPAGSGPFSVAAATGHMSASGSDVTSSVFKSLS